MHKKIKEYFESKGLKITKETGYGIINGFETNLIVRMTDNVSPVFVHINTFIPEINRKEVLTAIHNMGVKQLKASITPYGLSLGLNSITVGKLMNKMDDILNAIFAILTDYQALNHEYCPVCGNKLPENAKAYSVEGLMITMDEECVNHINATIKMENDNFNQAPNNRLRGMLGALVGAIVGAVIFYILYTIGFVSAITSFVSIVLGVVLYKKFGGKPDKIMILIVTLVTFVVLILTLLFIYVSASNVLVTEYGFTSTGIQAFKDMMTVKEFKASFTSDLVMTIIFTAIGAGYEVYSLTKKVKRMDQIK